HGDAIATAELDEPSILDDSDEDPAARRRAALARVRETLVHAAEERAGGRTLAAEMTELLDEDTLARAVEAVATELQRNSHGAPPRPAGRRPLRGVLGPPRRAAAVRRALGRPPRRRRSVARAVGDPYRRLLEAGAHRAGDGRRALRRVPHRPLPRRAGRDLAPG